MWGNLSSPQNGRARATKRKRVAIVGSGCSGIAALWALSDAKYDVHLYEADEVLGGHTNTVTYKHNDEEVNVDTGFIVFNSATYPNFIRFLESLGVATVPTEMTFGISRDYGKFEWAGTSLGAVFAQWSSVFSPRMWRMVYDIIRFNQYALDLLADEDESDIDPSTGASTGEKDETQNAGPRHQSIGDYLSREGYSASFRDDYLIPMTAAVWSTDPDKCSLDFPAVTLVRFMWNHHLLTTVARRPPWMTIPGGSRQYIDAVMKDFPMDNVHLKCPVVSIEDINGKIILQFENDEEELFDHVILACHGDQAHEIIKDGGTEEERSILSNFKTSENTAFLHSDASLMPKRRITWAAWNYLTLTPPAESDHTQTAHPTSVSLTYNMNILQHIPTSTFGDVLVTLNPLHTPSVPTIQGRWTYHHPQYTAASINAQKLLPRIQNTRGISYAGAWTKYGFHEDGLSSGLKVAMEHLGAELPWEFVDSTFSRGKKPRRSWGDSVARGCIWWTGVGIWWVELLAGVISWPWTFVAGWWRGKGKKGKAKDKAQ
ncbi:MAG: hypothetical protein M1828_003971 [Chrysothrix sp. TS-e1954]|nr:MAG: hypothetical protein M1828_003971 [Chrysothrix sp. TS-e1954]